LAEASGMKDCCTRGNEHLIFYGATHDVSIRSDQAVIADAQRMASGTSQNRVLHNDALAADSYGPALSDDLRPEHHATARAHGDVAADDSIRCDPGGGIDSGRDAIWFDEHVVRLARRVSVQYHIAWRLRGYQRLYFLASET